MATLKPGTKKDIVVSQIVIQQNPRKTQDIGNWRKAIKQFENPSFPSRTELYDLLEDIELDGQVFSAWGKRVAPVLNKELLYVKDGVEDTEIQKLLNSYDMYRLKKAILDSIKYGHILVQVNNVYFDADEERYRIDFDVIPRKHVHPEKGWECISKSQALSKDILYRERPLYDYMIEVDHDDLKYGILYIAAQYVIYKRGGFGDWAQFSEMFGMPFREFEYDAFDETTKASLRDAAENWGGAGYILRPSNTTLKLHDVGSSGNAGGPYDAFTSKCDAAISKIILGNTLTTEQGNKGSQSLGKVHKEGEEELNEQDALLLLSILNGKFRAILKKFGFNVTGGEIWFKTPPKNWEILVKKWGVIKEMKETLPIDDNYIYEEFDVPKPDDYEARKKQMIETQHATSPNATSKNPTDKTAPVETRRATSQNAASKNKRVKLSDAFRTLFDFFAKAPAQIGAQPKPSSNYTTSRDVACRVSYDPRRVYLADAAAQSFDINELFTKALENIYNEAVDVDTEIEPYIYQFTADKLSAALEEGFTNIDDSEFLAQLRYNTNVFAAFKTHDQQKALHAIMFDEAGDLKPFSQFLTDSKPLLGQYNHNWLQTEYDTAVLRARIAQQWRQFESDVDIFPNLKWVESTSLEKRPFHKRFSDIPIILPINHPFWKKHLPGDLWNCKCGLTNTDEEPTPANLIPDVDFQPAPGLDNNPGIDGKIFSDTHPFIANAPADLLPIITDFIAKQ